MATEKCITKLLFEKSTENGIPVAVNENIIFLNRCNIIFKDATALKFNLKRLPYKSNARIPRKIDLSLLAGGVKQKLSWQPKSGTG